MKEKEILELMSNVGSCYKKDLMHAMDSEVTNNGSTRIARLKKLGYLVEGEVLGLKRDSKGKKLSTISITLKGRNRLGDLNQNDYSPQLGRIVNKRFSSTTPADIHREMARSRIALVMNHAGIRTFYADKPSFPRLFEMAVEEDVNPSPNEWAYSNDLNLEETISGCGVYYTLAEFKELFDRDIAVDTLTGTRMKGIYLSAFQTCIVFQTDLFDGKTIRLKTETERRMLKMVQKYTIQINGVEKIDAIVLTSGTAVIVDMGICGKNGVIRRQDTSATNHDNTKSMYAFLNSECKLFDNIYCFPHTTMGATSLQFFAEHQEMSEYEWATEIGEQISHMRIIEEEYSRNHLYLRDMNTDEQTIVMPWYNVRLLGAMNKLRENISVITFEKMAEDVSHITRRYNVIYDMHGNEIEVGRYEQSGRPVGYIEPDQKPSTHAGRRNRHKVSFELSDEDYKSLRSILYYTDSTASSYLKKKLIPIIREDSKEYSEMRELERKKKELLSLPYIPKK